MDAYDRLNKKEQTHVRAHPINAYYIWRNRETAFAETECRFGMNGRNDRSDGFRHCFWSAMLTRDIAAHEARKFTTLHEMRPGNELVEKNTDLHNNKVGIEISTPSASDSELANDCKSALDAGRLIFF